MKLENSHREHEHSDNENFKDVDGRMSELSISNARMIGIAAGIIGFLSVLSTVASIWAALK